MAGRPATKGMPPPELMRAQRVEVSAAAVALVSALVLYVPWQTRPFDVLDFCEFVPLLRSHSGFWPRFVALVDYYAVEQGRFNVLPYAAIAGKWTVLAQPVAWQLLRFLEMALATAAAWLLLYNLVGSRTAAALGSSLFLVAGTASGAWVRLTMAEPLGLLFLLSASLLALRYSTSRRWKPAALAIAVLLGCTVLTKEMLVTTVPFVMILALCRRADGEFGAPSLDLRGAWLLTSIAGVVVLAGIPITWFATRAHPSGFGTLYQVRSTFSLAHFLNILLTFSLPHSPVFWDNVLSFLTTNYLFVVVIAAASIIAARQPKRRRRFAWLLALSGTLPFLGSVAYTPWPLLQQFYGLPYLPGPALALAASVAEVEAAAPSLRGLAYTGATLVLVGSGLTAYRQARYAVAEQEINVALASVLTQSPAGDSIFVGVRRLPALAWIGRGPTLKRYALAFFNSSLGPAADITCNELSKRDVHPSATLVSLNVTCGPLRQPDAVVLRSYHFLYWPKVTIGTDSLRGDMEFARQP